MKLLLTFVLFCTAWIAPLASAAPVIFLVRHAEKAKGPFADLKNPALSAAGRTRARNLAATLRDAGITAIFTSEFKRTQETARPLAEAAHLRLTIVPAKDSARLIALLRKTKGNALVVGHSNTLPEITRALGVSPFPKIEESDYDNLFVVKLAPHRELLTLHYR